MPPASVPGRETPIAENDLIRYFRQHQPPDQRLRLGVGDDAAVLAGPRQGWELVFAADAILEGTHFLLSAARPEQIAHKVLAENLSDLAAMGAEPLAFTCTLQTRPALGDDFARAIFEGLARAAVRYGIALAGGDVIAGKEAPLALSVAVLGEVPEGQALRRSGGREGDRLWVTGALGGSYASGKHLEFEPRLREGILLRQLSLATAAIDVSDGLARDLRHLCEASGTGAIVRAESVPLSPTARQAEDPLGTALGDGEDFELLFAARPEATERLLAAWEGRDDLAPLAEIGCLVAAERGLLLRGGAGDTRPLPLVGWEHDTGG